MSVRLQQTEPTTSRPARRPVWWRRPWVVPLMIATGGFLAYAVPPYLSLDPSRARLAPLPDSPLFYPLLVTHILLGSVVLITACLQVWPWLRRTYPAIHRTSGRIYVACLVPAALAVIIIGPLTKYGANQQVANTTLGVLWLVCTVSGYRAARQRRFGDHRRWMIRSVALSFSIVTNRVWTVICIAVFAPEVFGTGPVDAAALNQAVGVAAWLSWLVNLAVAEGWLRRRRGRSARTRRAGIDQ